MPKCLNARVLIPGIAQGELVASNVPLSFWGGVDAKSGTIIDNHHPLVGRSIAGKILMIPSGRGSCTGSGVILELLLNGSHPSAMIFGREEMILTIGVLIAQEIFQKSIPVVQVSSSVFEDLLRHDRMWIDRGRICLEQPDDVSPIIPSESPSLHGSEFSSIQVSSLDREFLDGVHGRAVQVAMRVILRMAQIQGVTELIDVTQAHIDCCIYTGPATLKFARQLHDWGARVRIPTSLNSISIDQRLWRAQGVDPDLGEPSEQLAQAYVGMGAQPTFTCAPYLLETAPKRGENVIWAESNAVVFANSVLGARSIKCPDFLDVCVALTGRSLKTGCHLTANRKARVQVHLEPCNGTDDSLYPLLGYLVGDIAADRIPIVTGLEAAAPSIDDLKAFGAAFATTSSAAMFHIAGVTIEARTDEEIRWHLTDTNKVDISRSDLATQYTLFNAPAVEEFTPIDLVSLGNPHFSHDEIIRLLSLCAGRTKSLNTALVITCNRDTYSRAAKEGHIRALEEFGAQIITDTCWCMIQEPIIPVDCQIILTNSAKYAHYGRGLTGRQVRFGGLTRCVDAACAGGISNQQYK
ncbi:Aconitase/3-isopropylmalate dehydratase large subunit alpha/beta/alpha subdomain 1/3 [Penicillium capsulatum]|uniref:Aconitase/3-isopropylmalate dehydratase large subunit alpha/beta/alpha subdomain 1/3 n=1 Tax=Penicillium capsulatum TaxID=69766 RepID=A0A9W9LI93_9EURO|nr:Aconitase/3-isopropylmalate dehydratase large subunit alpha/beta/alpha subdomain 1/3 [Penicillium capsulatum]KAJ6106997.1 Aconitase/3-isopropylmalate dehydratase large subunit alpha/beta/alpha subdomain 1/3 [Penicillium capsulatum]